MSDFEDLAKRTKDLSAAPNGDAVKEVVGTAIERGVGIQNLIGIYQVDPRLIQTLRNTYGTNRVRFIETTVTEEPTANQIAEGKKARPVHITIEAQYEYPERFDKTGSPGSVRFFASRDLEYSTADTERDLRKAHRSGEIAPRTGLKVTRSRERGKLKCPLIKYIARNTEFTDKDFKTALLQKISEDVTARGA